MTKRKKKKEELTEEQRKTIMELEELKQREVTEQKLKDAGVDPSTDLQDTDDKQISFKDMGPWLIRLRNGFKLKYKKHHLLIRMEMRSGDHEEFLVDAQNFYGFKFKEGFYLFDNELKYYVASSKIYAMDFHQDYCLPIRRRIPLSEISKVLESLPDMEIENATNPKVLQKFAISKIAEGVMQGQQMSDMFKKITIMLVIIMISSFITAILMLNESGVLSNLKLW